MIQEKPICGCGRIEFEQGYAPSAKEIFLEGMIKFKENALSKQNDTIERLNWEIDIYRNFVFKLINKGVIKEHDDLMEADKVLKCITIKRTYYPEGR